jgi:hypothetical protein
MKPMKHTVADASWKLLYAVGCALALVYVIMVIIPLVLLFAAPRPPATGGAAVLSFIAAHRAVYVTELFCFVGLSVPALGVVMAVSVALKDTNRSLAAIGGLTALVSEILALGMGSSPQSLSSELVYLSDQYMAAATEAQRVALSSAAEGFLATANAVAPAGVLTALGILLLSLCMLRGVFHRGVAVLGIVTGGFGIVLEALRPYVGMLYGVYGLLLPTWFVVVGIRLFRLGFGKGLVRD